MSSTRLESKKSKARLESKKIILSTVSGFSEVRRSVIVCPAALNARLLAALEAGTLRILRVKTFNLEYE